MKYYLLALLLAMGVVSLAAGCGPKQAPIVEPPTPQQQSQSIQSNPYMSAQQKQQALASVQAMQNMYGGGGRAAQQEKASAQAPKKH